MSPANPQPNLLLLPLWGLENNRIKILESNTELYFFIYKLSIISIHLKSCSMIQLINAHKIYRLVYGTYREIQALTGLNENFQANRKLDYNSAVLWSVAQSCPTLCDPMDCSPPWGGLHPSMDPRLPHPGDSPGKNTGVGCHFLLQGIFLTQGSNPCLLHWQADSLPRRHPVSSYYNSMISQF